MAEKQKVVRALKLHQLHLRPACAHSDHLVGDIDERGSIVAEVNNGFNEYFPFWYKLSSGIYREKYKGIIARTGVLPDLEALSGMHPSIRPDRVQVENFIKKNRDPFSVYFKAFFLPAHGVVESLDFLTQNGIKKIHQHYPRREPIAGGSSNGYTIDGLRKITESVILNIFSSYEEFINSNEIDVPDSRYLSPKNAFIYYVNYEKWMAPDSYPAIECFTVDNQSSLLPKVQLIEGEATRKGEFLYIDSQKLKLSWFGWASADALFQRLPILNCMYSMLVNDLDKKFGFKLKNNLSVNFI